MISKNPKKEIPNYLHLLRGKHWQQILKEEEIAGDTLKQAKKLFWLSKLAVDLKTKNRLPKNKTKILAELIALRLSFLADETITRMNELGLKYNNWNSVYHDLKKQLYKLHSIPIEVKKEIALQKRKE